MTRSSKKGPPQYHKQSLATGREAVGRMRFAKTK